MTAETTQGPAPDRARLLAMSALAGAAEDGARDGRRQARRSARNVTELVIAVREAGLFVSTAQGALSDLLRGGDPALLATADGSDLADELSEIERRLRHCARIAERQQAAGTEGGK